ncbi:hypothetical protein [Vibrio parahaemolyticus]|nr:hypothetical protein [Vibrio parahaemolyticus]
MKKTPDINPESQDVAELQAMVKACVFRSIPNSYFGMTRTPISV